VRAFARRHLHFGDDVEPSGFPDGAALSSGSRGVVYRTGDGRHALGPALAWAGRRDVRELHLLIDHDGGDLARRARLLGGAASVWRMAGDRAEPVEASPRSPETGPPPDIGHLVAVIERHGLEAVAEHGVVTAELSGLEIARIEDRGDGPRIEVGVGRFDREAGELLRQHHDVDARMADALLEVGPYRQRGAEPHPVNRLSRERWLRSIAVADPTAVDLVELRPVSPARPRPDLRQAVAAPGVGRDQHGARVLVLFSAGVDLDVVPHAAELVDREQVDQVRFVSLERDQLEPIRRMARYLPVPNDFLAIDPPWPV